MTVAAGLAVQGNSALYERWHEKGQEISFGQARAWLRDCVEGREVDAEAAPDSVFGDDETAWLKERYATLCAYAHSRAGYNNADFWESSGPDYRPRALEVVDEELRKTLALCYLLLRLGWPGYVPRQRQSELLGDPRGGWARFEDLLRRWLLRGKTASASVKKEPARHREAIRPQASPVVRPAPGSHGRGFP